MQNQTNQSIAYDAWCKFLDKKPSISEKNFTQEKFNEAIADLRVTQQHMRLLIGALVTPTLHEKFFSFINHIFPEDWYHRSKYTNHPLARNLVKPNSSDLNGLLETFLFSMRFLGEDWFKKHPEYLNYLRDSEDFTSTFFEIEILSLLKRDGFDIDPSYSINEKSNVEAKIEKNNWKGFVECKCLRDSKRYHYFKKEFFKLSVLNYVEGSLFFFVYPSEEDIELIKKAVDEVQCIESERFQLTVNKSLKKAHQGSGIKVNNWEQPDDNRIRTTLNNTIKKFRGKQSLSILLVKINISEGPNNAYKKIQKFLNEKKYDTIDQVLVVIKSGKGSINPLANSGDTSRITGQHIGYDYNMFFIKNPQSKYERFLYWGNNEFKIGIPPKRGSPKQFVGAII